MTVCTQKARCVHYGLSSGCRLKFGDQPRFFNYTCRIFISVLNSNWCLRNLDDAAYIRNSQRKLYCFLHGFNNSGSFPLHVRNDVYVPSLRARICTILERPFFFIAKELFHFNKVLSWLHNGDEVEVQYIAQRRSRVNSHVYVGFIQSNPVDDILLGLTISLLPLSFKICITIIRIS